MPDKILCPWCGAEMVRDGEALVRSDEVAVWMRCISCGASSPLIKGPQTLNLEKLYDMAHAAALRRYTPPLKPMTREELPRRYCLPCWIEEKDGKALPDVLDRDSTGFFGIIDNVHRRNTKYLMFADYGETWRCWERKPTDEERSAAEWET